MKKFILKISLLITALFISATTFAQQNPFTGTWTLQDKTHISGTEYANAIPAQLKFSATNTELTLTRTEVSADENTPGAENTEKLTLEPGKGTVGQTPDKRKMTTTCKLEGNTLTETKTITQPGQETLNFRIKETNTVSADGKTLTLVKEFEDIAVASDKWTVKGTYQKQ